MKITSQSSDDHPKSTLAVDKFLYYSSNSLLSHLIKYLLLSIFYILYFNTFLFFQLSLTIFLSLFFLHKYVDQKLPILVVTQRSIIESFFPEHFPLSKSIAEIYEELNSRQIKPFFRYNISFITNIYKNFRGLAS